MIENKTFRRFQLGLGFLVCIIACVGFLYNYFAEKAAENYYRQSAEKIIADIEKNTQKNSKKTTVKIVKENTNPKVNKREPISEIKEKETGEINQLHSVWDSYIYIPGTNICYPVMQGNDNKYYLNHLPTGSYSNTGSIFMDCNSNINDFNVILYGHNMKNDTMFGQLSEYYMNDTFAKEKNTMSLCLKGQRNTYKLLSVRVVQYDDNSYDKNPENKEEWVNEQYISSMVDCGYIDEITNYVTLSTCGSTDTEKIITIWARI